MHLKKRLQNISLGKDNNDPIRIKEESEGLQTQVQDNTWHNTSLTFKQHMYDTYAKDPQKFHPNNLQKYFFNYGVEKRKK